MFEIGSLAFLKRDITCLTGFCLKNEPVQIIRKRDNNLYDAVNLRNQLLFKIPQSMLMKEQSF